MKFPGLRRGIATVAAAMVLLAGCGTAGDEAPGDSPSQVLTLGAAIEPTSFDPGQAQEGHYMQYYQAVYDTLIRRLPDGEFAPMLATDWSYNDDNTELTLTIRGGVVFTDGAVLDAAAVKANLDAFRTGTGPQSSTLSRVTAVEAVEDSTIVISLESPEPALLNYLSNAAGLMASPSALGTADLATNPVGTGPYVLDSSRTTTGSAYVFAARDDYWDPELQKYDEIVINPYVDVTARMNALVSGQINAAYLDAKTAEQARSAGLTEYAQTVDWQGLIILDRAGTIVPALADERVRQAINYAIDADAILQQIQLGYGEKTNQIFGPASTAYDEAFDSAYDYDPDRARDLLAEAGYEDGFAMTIPVTSTFDQAMVAAITDQLAAVGIELVHAEVAAADFITALLSQQYPVTWMQLFQPSTWATVEQVVAPDALFNALGSTSDELSALIDRVQADDDSAAVELNQWLVEQAWYNPWFRVDALYYADGSVVVELQTEQIVPSIYNYTPAS